MYRLILKSLVLGMAFVGFGLSDTYKFYVGNAAFAADAENGPLAASTKDPATLAASLANIQDATSVSNTLSQPAYSITNLVPAMNKLYEDTDTNSTTGRTGVEQANFLIKNMSLDQLEDFVIKTVNTPGANNVESTSVQLAHTSIDTLFDRISNGQKIDYSSPKLLSTLATVNFAIGSMSDQYQLLYPGLNEKFVSFVQGMSNSDMATFLNATTSLGTAVTVGNTPESWLVHRTLDNLTPQQINSKEFKTVDFSTDNLSMGLFHIAHNREWDPTNTQFKDLINGIPKDNLNKFLRNTITTETLKDANAFLLKETVSALSPDNLNTALNSLSPANMNDLLQIFVKANDTDSVKITVHELSTDNVNALQAKGWTFKDGVAALVTNKTADSGKDSTSLAVTPTVAKPASGNAGMTTFVKPSTSPAFTGVNSEVIEGVAIQAPPEKVHTESQAIQVKQ